MLRDAELFSCGRGMVAIASDTDPVQTMALFPRWPVLALIAISAAMPAVARADGETLAAADIRKDIIGRRIYLAAPLGGELPLHYSSTGTVDGSGEAVGLGKWLKPNDSGRWWIAGDRLCQKFQTWYDGKPMCFELKRSGAGKVFWRRDDGTTGIARIGN